MSGIGVEAKSDGAEEEDVWREGEQGRRPGAHSSGRTRVLMPTTRPALRRQPRPAQIRASAQSPMNVCTERAHGPAHTWASKRASRRAGRLAKERARRASTRVRVRARARPSTGKGAARSPAWSRRGPPLMPPAKAASVTRYSGLSGKSSGKWPNDSHEYE
eukprot:6183898-Pleurochrysis_carterae.AAC.7